MNIFSIFCKHKWSLLHSEKVKKKRTLRDFWPYGQIEINDYSCLEYEVLSEAYVCDKCGEIKHFVS